MKRRETELILNTETVLTPYCVLNNNGARHIFSIRMLSIPMLKPSNDNNGCLFSEYILLDDKIVDHPIQIPLQGKTSALAAGEWCQQKAFTCHSLQRLPQLQEAAMLITSFQEYLMSSDVAQCGTFLMSHLKYIELPMGID